MKRIGVVIPLFNHGTFIRGTLESVLAQTRPPDRIVIVDDGSTDDSVERAAAVTDSRIEIHRQSNAGAHAALNRGVALASDCDYVAILNSDDQFLPARLEICETALEQSPEISLVCTALELVDPEDQPLDPRSGRARWFHAAWSSDPAALSLPARLGIANFPATTSNLFARTTWLMEHPFRPYRYAHDYFALATAAILGELRVLPEPLMRYRVHPANTMNTAPANLTREMIAVHLDLMRSLAPHTDRPEVRAALADYFRHAWMNFSSFRADVFQTALARALATMSDAALDSVCATLDGDTIPELNSHPNLAFIAAGQTPPSPGTLSLLAVQIERLKAREAELKILKAKEHAAAAEASRRSRWKALKTLLRMPGSR